ncbi:MAG: sulfatase-like hydrolase/transferase [Verrucomicrobia bacterium]|nr:sulfatase-like hydrolase/transferase [Verrucomicrobiota bacterium]
MLALLAGVGGVAIAAAVSVKIRSGFVYPAFFDCFRALFFAQQGLFPAAVLVTAVAILPRNGIGRTLSFVGYFVFFLWLFWLLIWAVVHRVYGIELTFSIVIELLTNWSSIREVGLTPAEFWSAVAGACVIAAAMALLTAAIARRTSPRQRFTSFCFVALLFLALHLPVRAYIAFEEKRNQPAVLAYDDCVAVPLRSEELLPWLGSARISIPNFGSAENTRQYFQALAQMQFPPLPKRPNILWLNVESLRFDAANATDMPQLWARRDLFQVRLAENHWSGGNATQFGVFSMLSGLSGLHLANFQERHAQLPLLRLLAANNYRLSGGKRSYFDYARMDRLLPPEMRLPNIRRGSPFREDFATVDAYLSDHAALAEGTATFDFIPFDATHWPYWFPKGDAPFQPAPLTHASQHVLRSGEEMTIVRNRYRDACHYIDEQMARIFAQLDEHGAWRNTIVIVVGDHGEEFEERGQLTHAAILNAFQGRTICWIHFPENAPPPIPPGATTTHLDIVPTLLAALGLSGDVLYTQGHSFFAPIPPRPLLALSEEGFRYPLYRALVSPTYISRWANGERRCRFSGVQRRDGAPVRGQEWLQEVRAHLREAAGMYEVLPDTSRAAQPVQAHAVLVRQ